MRQDASQQGTSPAADAVDAIVAAWHRERPDLDPSAKHVTGRIVRLAGLVQGAYAEAFAPLGLNDGDYGLLATLRRAGEPFRLTPTDLARHRMMTSGGMTAAIDRLERKGLVVRLPNPNDRRGNLVQLSDEGRRLVDAAMVVHTEAEHRLVAALSPAEREQLAGLLRTLLLGLEERETERVILAADEIIASIPTWVDVTSVAVGATSGALVAVKNRFDISGIMMIAIVTGMGGGIIRDVLIQQGTPVALTSKWLLPTAVVVGAVISLFSRTVDRMHSRTQGLVVVVDAVFLGVYAIVGTTKGLDAGLPGVSCVFLGVMTGVGGGLLRDVLINEQPQLLRPGGFVAMAAILGCTFNVVAVRTFELAGKVGVIGIAMIVTIRLLSVWRHWESPVPTDVYVTARTYTDPVRRRRITRVDIEAAEDSAAIVDNSEPPPPPPSTTNE